MDLTFEEKEKLFKRCVCCCGLYDSDLPPIMPNDDRLITNEEADMPSAMEAAKAYMDRMYEFYKDEISQIPERRRAREEASRKAREEYEARRDGGSLAAVSP